MVLFAWRRLPDWHFQALLALGTVITCLGMYLSQPIPGDTAMFFIWVVLYSAYFFDRAWTVGQIVVIAVAYGATLAIVPGTQGDAARWLITMGTLILVATLVTLLKEAVRRRMEERQRSERELEESVSLLNATLQSTADGMLVVDNEGAIVSFNRRSRSCGASRTTSSPRATTTPRSATWSTRSPSPTSSSARSASSTRPRTPRAMTSSNSRTAGSSSATPSPSVGPTERCTGACGAFTT